jgi:hypothetical protein
LFYGNAYHPLKPKQGFDFMGPIKLVTRYIGNQYIIVPMDYTTKWVEAKALWDNMAQNTTKFMYEHIIICFGCPTDLVSDQENHLLIGLLKYSHKNL